MGSGVRKPETSQPISITVHPSSSEGLNDETSGIDTTATMAADLVDRRRRTFIVDKPDLQSACLVCPAHILMSICDVPEGLVLVSIEKQTCQREFEAIPQDCGWL
jgi:hypothetical protein